MDDFRRRDCVRPQTGTQVEKTTLVQRPLQLRIEQGERVLDVLRTGDAAPLGPFASPRCANRPPSPFNEASILPASSDEKTTVRLLDVSRAMPDARHFNVPRVVASGSALSPYGAEA